MEFSGAGAGAENSIFFRLRLQQKSTAPGGSGSVTLVPRKHFKKKATDTCFLPYFYSPTFSFLQRSCQEP